MVNDFMDIDLMINRFGVIPKDSKGKWQLIVDLLFLEGSSVNDGIESDICLLHYAKVEDATKELVKPGHNSWMTKVDIRRQYQCIPRISGCWVCSGKELCLWIQHCHSN